MEEKEIRTEMIRLETDNWKLIGLTIPKTMMFEVAASLTLDAPIEEGQDPRVVLADALRQIADKLESEGPYQTRETDIDALYGLKGGKEDDNR